MASRAAQSGITYVAFTATPKPKTMELLGTRFDPAKPASPTNLPAPFHVYSMCMCHRGKIHPRCFAKLHPLQAGLPPRPQRQGLRRKNRRKKRRHEGDHGLGPPPPYNISSQKVEIVVEHFLQYVAPLLKGKAKAMVVVGSRVEAVRWQLAINKYIKENNYKIGTVVAFSGEVNDKDSGPDAFTENSQTLNPNLRGRDIREAFKGEEYQILLVANKFQTGFDQPLLCGMYVDKTPRTNSPTPPTSKPSSSTLSSDPWTLTTSWPPRSSTPKPSKTALSTSSSTTTDLYESLRARASG